MRFDDKLFVQRVSGGGYDENLDPIEPTTEFVEVGRCVIFPNTKALKVTLNDGREYQYSFEIVAPIKKKHYKDGLIPKEGEEVRFTKKDGTIDKQATVQGFVTLKQRYVKVWL